MAARTFVFALSTLGVVLAAALSTMAAESPSDVVLTVRETAGVARLGEPVTSGVPLPRDVLSDASGLRLCGPNGQEVPAQFRVTGRWLPGKSIRWVLVDFQTDCDAGQERTYTLTTGTPSAATPEVPRPVRVTEEPERYVVDTGTARFVLGRQSFSLFESVELAGGTVLTSRAAERSGGRAARLAATVTRAVPAPGNKGNAHLIHAEPGPDAPAEQWTLTFEDANRFQVRGSVTGPDGGGVAEWGRGFTSKSGRLIIPEDAWLSYREGQAGDVFTFSTVPAGTEAWTGPLFSSTVRERGPLRTVIEFKGGIGEASSPVLEFTARYHFFAGSSRVRLDFTLENNDHSGRTESGNVEDAEIGTANTVFFEEFSLHLPVEVGEEATWWALGDPKAGLVEGKLSEPVTLYQDSSGTDHWDRYRSAEFHPRPNSYVTFRGYRVDEGGKARASGNQAVGWLDVTGSRGGVGVTVRDFWQNFPKALTARPGRLEVGLFPSEYAGAFPLRPGEHKTHRLLFDFHGPGGDAAKRCETARAWSAPLMLEPSAQWWAGTQVLGVLHPYDPKRFPEYEVRNLSTIGEFPQGFEDERISLLSRIEALDFYGWMDFGDVPIDFEFETGQWNLKYDFDLGMLIQYARTGRLQWLRLFRAAAEHASDIDVNHAPHYPELHFLKGGNWAHSIHDEPGNLNPHRNTNHFTRDLSFATRGPAAYYYLTGDWKAHDTVVERAECALAEYMSPQEEPADQPFPEVGQRGNACTMQSLLEGYLLTGEERFRERARWCVKECAFVGKVDPQGSLSFPVWSTAFYAMALERYCSLFPEDALARKTFLAHADALVTSVDPAGKTGACYTLTLRGDGSVEREDTCSHYNIMIADVLASAYRMTRQARYLDAGRSIFPYGVKNACWEDGPATYQHVHSAAGSTHGSVYMATVSAEAR